MNFYYLSFIFFIYSFLGYISEVVYSTLKKGKFINRGFLNGPLCPIYGFGIVLIAFLTTPLINLISLSGNINLFIKALIIFFVSSFLATLIEFITGLVLEKFFHKKWWDYSEERFNLFGYICLKFSIIWGAVAFIILTVIHPLILDLVKLIPFSLGVLILIFLYSFIFIDLIITVIQIIYHGKTYKRIKKIERILNSSSDKIGGKVSSATIKFKNVYNKFINSRLIKAFPNLIKKEDKKEDFQNLKNKK